MKGFAFCLDIVVVCSVPSTMAFCWVLPGLMLM
jgi:hypothetical protein